MPKCIFKAESICTKVLCFNHSPSVCIFDNSASVFDSLSLQNLISCCAVFNCAAISSIFNSLDSILRTMPSNWASASSYFIVSFISLFTIDVSHRACSRSAKPKQAWFCSRLIAAFTIHCSLFTVHYSLFTIHCSLFTTERIVPFSTRVSISSPTFSSLGSRIARPFINVILYPLLSNN